MASVEKNGGYKSNMVFEAEEIEDENIDSDGFL